MKRAVFLDRDGVLNRAVVRDARPHPPGSLAELEVTPDVGRALSALRSAGFVLLGVTNQPDVVRGAQRREVVEAINAALLAELPLHDILVCFHDDVDRCGCRKPAPGLLLEAAKRFGIDLDRSVMVGDRWKDVEAGQRAGCSTILIGDGYGEPMRSLEPSARLGTVLEAAEWILRQPL